MPTFRHGKKTVVLLNGVNMSPFLNESTATTEMEAAETTTYGNEDKTYIVGLSDGTVSLSGLFDGAAGASDEVLEGLILTEDNSLTVLLEGATVGTRAVVVPSCQITTYEVTSPVADVVSMSVEAQADGGVPRGVALAALSTISATASVTAVDNAESSANGAVATLHVTSNSHDGNTVVKVQHSSDDNTYVDLMTFTTVSASTTGAYTASAAGTVNRYLRAVATLAGSTGSVTYTVAAARR